MYQRVVHGFINVMQLRWLISSGFFVQWGRSCVHCVHCVYCFLKRMMPGLAKCGQNFDSYYSIILWIMNLPLNWRQYWYISVLQKLWLPDSFLSNLRKMCQAGNSFRQPYGTIGSFFLVSTCCQFRCAYTKIYLFNRMHGPRRSHRRVAFY